MGTSSGIQKDGKAKVKIDHKLVITPLSNLIKIDDPKPEIDALLWDDHYNEIKKPLSNNNDQIIDLHIAKLAPQMHNSLPMHILTFQIEACKKFINEAINRRHPYIHIIHGKGQGVLKSEIEQLVRSYPEVRFIFEKNDGGALEVWL